METVRSSHKNRMAKRLLVLLLAAALLASLIPLYAAARYSRAGADDYRYGYRAHEAWVKTGSLGAALAGAAAEAAATYTQWQGSYGAIFLMALEPGVFSDTAYGASTWLLLTAFTAGMLYFLSALFRLAFGMERWAAWAGSLLVTLSAVQFVPYPCEAFFWFNGGVYYTFFFSLSLFFAGALMRRTVRKSAAQWILLPLLAAFIGGGNLVTGFLLCGLLLLYAVWAFLRHKADPCALLALGVLLAAFLINALAPGNGVRQAEHLDAAAASPFAAILAGLRDAARYGGEWLVNPASLLSLALLPLYWHGAGRPPFQDGGRGAKVSVPILLTVFSFLLLAAGFTPTEYALSQAGEGRLLNIQYDMFLILLQVDLWAWTGWVRFMAEKKRGRGAAPRALCRGLAAGLVAAGFFLAGGAAVLQRTGASVSAARILTNGSAASYGAGWDARFALLYNEEEKDVVLPRMENKPPLLCLMDPVPGEADENYWYNEQIERYFHKDRVLAEPE